MPTNLNENPLYEEYNKKSSFEICYHSQEQIQDLVSKTGDLAFYIRYVFNSLVYGDQATYLQRKSKVEEVLKYFEVILVRLRFFGALIHQRKLAIDQQHHQQQQQQQDQTDSKETETTTSATLEQLTSEKQQLIEQIRLKNNYIKLAIDKISDIIWQINSIQTIKN